MFPRDFGRGCLDDELDGNGDRIIVRRTLGFLYNWSASVVAEFSRGMSPEIVPSVLRNFALTLDIQQ